jgi:hypothetical protein
VVEVEEMRDKREQLDNQGLTENSAAKQGLAESEISRHTPMMQQRILSMKRVPHFQKLR